MFTGALNAVSRVISVVSGDINSRLSQLKISTFSAVQQYCSKVATSTLKVFFFLKLLRLQPAVSLTNGLNYSIILQVPVRTFSSAFHVKHPCFHNTRRLLYLLFLATSHLTVPVEHSALIIATVFRGRLCIMCLCHYFCSVLVFHVQ